MIEVSSPDSKIAPPGFNTESTWPADAIEVGRIGEAWGIKGWVKVLSYSSDPQALFRAKRWFLKASEDRKALPKPGWVLPASVQITQVREHGEGIVASVEGVIDRNGAEALRGARIFTSRAEFPSPKADEYYWIDLIGLQVLNTHGDDLGAVIGLIDTGPHSVLRVMPVGGGPTRVLAYVYGGQGTINVPSWSPDGRQLAVVLSRDGFTQIYTMNLDGSGLKRLTHTGSIETEPNWSPDGKYLLFTSDRGGSPQIYRMPSYGGEAVRLTFEGSYNVSPRYNPDGKSFVFIRREGNQFRVAVQDILSGQVQVLTENGLDESPSWAPNGKMILYATERLGRGVLAAVSSDGRVKQKLSAQASDVREPSWGPMLGSKP